MIDFLITNAKLGVLVLFSSFFAIVLVWTFWPGNAARFTRYARQPLENDDEQ